jgi:hypothetical protein
MAEPKVSDTGRVHMKFLPSPIRGWRMSEHEIDANEAFVEQVLKLWDAGLDTEAISRELIQWEHIVERALHRGKERRRRQEEAQ